MTVDGKGACRFELDVLNPDPADRAAIRLSMGFAPKLARNPVLRRDLESIEGIEDVIPRAPLDFGMDFGRVDVEIVEHGEGGERLVEAHLSLEPLEYVSWGAQVDLSDTPRLVPVPITVTQDYPAEDPERELPPGGITIAFVRV